MTVATYFGPIARKRDSMNSRRLYPGLLVLLSGLLSGSMTDAAGESASSVDPFADGARWCFVGDEITQRGSYLTWIALYSITRFPDRGIEIANAGMHGDTVSGALQRFEWDVKPADPGIVSVLFGANDAGMSLYEPGRVGPDLPALRAASLEEYRSNLRELIRRIRVIGSKPLLLGPPIYDETSTVPGSPVYAGLDGALAACSTIAREVAGEAGAEFVDFHEPMLRLNRERQAVDPTASIMGPDRRIPDPGAQLLMAWVLLKAMRAPAEVAALSIDLRAGRFAASNSTVENVLKSDLELTFDWTARALPLPMALDSVSVLSWAPVVDDLSREVLQVAGLRAGEWQLSIDGVRIGTYSNEQLGAGVNIAVEPQTPQYRQARDVMRLVEARARLIADNLRSVAFVEHHLAPGIPRPVKLEDMRPLLAGHDPNPGWQEPERAAFALYGQRKAREGATVAAASRILAQAKQVARPQSHRYQLRFLR